MSWTAVERDDVIAIIRSHLAFFGRTLESNSQRIWLDALGQSYSVAAIRSAFESHAQEARSAPKPVDILNQLRPINSPRHNGSAQRPAEASPSVAAAWQTVIRLWGAGDFFGAPDVDVETLDRQLDICNRQSLASGTPDAIPPDAWLDSVWGCSREEALRRAAGPG